MNKHEPSTQKEYPPIENTRLRYLLDLPPGSDDTPGKKWSVPCFLHGKGEAAINVDNHTKAETPQPIEVPMLQGTPP